MESYYKSCIKFITFYSFKKKKKKKKRKEIEKIRIRNSKKFLNFKNLASEFKSESEFEKMVKKWFYNFK